MTGAFFPDFPWKSLAKGLGRGYNRPVETGKDSKKGEGVCSGDRNTGKSTGTSTGSWRKSRCSSPCTWGGNVIQNTIQAYRIALDMGGDIFECDAALSADGVF